MNIQEIKFIVANTPPFNKLEEGALDEFIGLCEIKEYKTGQYIYRLDDPADFFYFLVQGRIVALTREGPRELEIELLKRGVSFGIISLFNDEPHSVTTKAIENSIVVRVEKEKFKQFLSASPRISLEFTRILSQRIRGRITPKKIFQCKRLCVAGLPSSGKTTYMYRCGTQLYQNTRKKVICVEFSLSDDSKLGALGSTSLKIASCADLKEENIGEFITRGPIDLLCIKVDCSSNFYAVLNYLSEHYHFILYEVPFSMWEATFNECFIASDITHFITPLNQAGLAKTNEFVHALKTENPFLAEKFSVIAGEFIESNDISIREIASYFEYPLYATLSFESVPDYEKTIRRIARQVGEVVVGIALGSGAAYGFAHIGVLKVLKAHNIPVDIVCGSSMGAVIAALWAMGYDEDQVTRFASDFGNKIKRFSLISISFPFKGFFKAKYLENVLKNIFRDKTFQDTKYALKIVTFDFSRRETRILEEGLLYKAVAASCAMPGVFEPIRVKEGILLDGGILNPLPTKVLLQYGVHKVVAVNITPSQEEILREIGSREKWHIFDFIFGSIETMQREFIQQALRIADVIIHPNFEGLNWMEFDKTRAFIERGARATEERIEDIKRLVFSL